MEDKKNWEPRFTASEQQWFQQPPRRIPAFRGRRRNGRRRQKKGVGEGSDFYTLHTNPQAGLLITKIKRCI